MNLSSPDMAFEPIKISDPSFSQVAAIPDSISSTSTSNAPNGTLLSDHFEPSNYDVICGRGKGCAAWVGNRRFRVTIAMNKERYIQAPTKIDKSLVVDEIVKTIAGASPNGGFVKKDSTTGKWYKINEQAARDKVGHAMRDAVQADDKKKRRKNLSSECRKQKAVTAAPVPMEPPSNSEVQPSANQVSNIRSSIRTSIRDSFRGSLKDSELAALLYEALGNSRDEDDLSLLYETAIFRFEKGVQV